MLGQIQQRNTAIMYGGAAKTLSRILEVPLKLFYTDAEQKSKRIVDRFLINFQDSMLPVGQLLDDLRKNGLIISDGMDTYLQEELYHGIVGDKINTNEANLYNPLSSAVKNINLTESQIDELKNTSTFARDYIENSKIPNLSIADIYLYALHAKERNDYISTEYGSQNKANCYSTDKGLYWIDNDHASICMVSIKQPNFVLNLSELKGCTSILSDIKRNKLFDKPLFVNKGTSQADTDIGGISISYNPYYNELLFSMSYYFNESDAKEVRNLTIAYNESIEQFIGKRSYSPILNCVHKGHMYSVGYEHSNVFSSETDVSRRKLFIHDSDNFTSSGVINTPVGFNNFYESSASNPSITFVNNEQVGSLKVFDKLVLSTEEIVDTGIFSKFVFNTNVDGVETLDLTSTDIDKVKAGKQIVPIFVSKRQKGNYVKIKVEQGTNQSLQKFNLFSATTYFRKNII